MALTMQNLPADVLFVNSTDFPRKGPNYASAAMRRHVMHDYISKQKKLVSERQGNFGVEAKDLSRKISTRRKNTQAISKHEGLVRIFQTKTQAMDRLPRPILQSIHHFLPDEVSKAPLHRLDSLSSSPIETRYAAELMNWHFKDCSIPGDIFRSDTPILQQLVLEGKESFWILALENPSLFHMLLCYTDSKRAAFTGKKIGVDYYIHKGKAIEAVQDLLSKPEKRLSHPSLSLLACLAALAYLDDGCEMSRVHMQAIVGICVRQNETPTLSRPHFQHLIWHDFRLAWATLRKPLFRYHPCETWAELPQSLLVEAHRLAMITSSILPALPSCAMAEHGPSGLYSFFNKLHQICLSNNIQTKPDKEIVLAVTNLFYCVCYKTSVLVAQECDSSKLGARLPAAALVLATQLFVLTCIPCQLHVKLYKSREKSLSEALCRDRLTALLLHSDDLISSWAASAPLESLLWILAVCAEWSRRSAVIDNVKSTVQLSRLLWYMRVVMTDLQITDKSGYERVLRMFPWTERLSVDMCDELWDLLHPKA